MSEHSYVLAPGMVRPWIRSRLGRTTIAEQFGDDFVALLAEVTDDKSLLQEVRKRLQVEQASKKSRRAKILKLADKISNLTAVGNDPASDWSVDRQRQYVQWGGTSSPACAARRHNSNNSSPLTPTA